MASPNRYHTAVVNGWLCLFVIQHGVFVYTAHTDEDGYSWWHYQGPKNRMDEFKNYQVDVPYEDMTTVEPKAAETMALFNFTPAEIIPRDYEALRKIVERFADHLISLKEVDPEILALARKVIAEKPRH